MAERLENKFKCDDRVRNCFEEQNRERVEQLKRNIPQVRKRKTKMVSDNDRVEITIENLLKIAYETSKSKDKTQNDQNSTNKQQSQKKKKNFNEISSKELLSVMDQIGQDMKKVDDIQKVFQKMDHEQADLKSHFTFDIDSVSTPKMGSDAE